MGGGGSLIRSSYVGLHIALLSKETGWIAVTSDRLVTHDVMMGVTLKTLSFLV